MPLQATSGAASYDAFGGGVAAVPQYIEDVFSTWLYSGNSSTQTITNGIDLSTKGGFVWIKSRSNTGYHQLFDTARGATKGLQCPDTAGQYTAATTLSAFTTSGFTLGSDSTVNSSIQTYASWAFRKQAKFFDVVTYTGTGLNRTIAHSLGSTPAFIIVKRTDGSSTTGFSVYHKNLTSAAYSLQLDTNAGQASTPTVWNSTAPTSTVFSVGTSAAVNANGGTYVAYIYASDAGGFGLAGTDNVITCGSFTSPATNSSVSVNLGYEPQWILFKDINNTADSWYLADSMRGLNVTSVAYVSPDNTNPQSTNATAYWFPTATGFSVKYGASYWFTPSNTVIYIAIRRGPMKVPTSGTSVFSTNAQTTTAPTTVTTNFPVDLELWRYNRTSAADVSAWDRLRGGTQYLYTPSTQAETTGNPSYSTYFDSNTTFRENFAGSGQPAIFWSFRRAPSFFDEVCYTGTGSATTVTHNLGVEPELIIVKRRDSSSYDWYIYNQSLGNTKYLYFGTGAASIFNLWNNTNPTSSVFSVSTYAGVNNSGSTYVAYLFATCAGVSKVGSYTGTGTTKQIDCGFTSGARFVLIKRTDSTGDWYVWDSARGIVAGNDPYLLLNSSAAEVTTTDYIDTYSAGFEISSTAPAAINASGGTFIFLAIA